MFRNNVIIAAPDGNAKLKSKTREGFFHVEDDGVVVNLLHRIKDAVGVSRASDCGILLDHVHREDNVVGVDIFAVGPLHAFTDLDREFREVFVGFRHTCSYFAELFTESGIDLPEMCGDQLMDTKSHLSSKHVGIELSGNVRRCLSLHDQGLGTRGSDVSHLLCESGYCEQHGSCCGSSAKSNEFFHTGSSFAYEIKHWLTSDYPVRARTWCVVINYIC